MKNHKKYFSSLFLTICIILINNIFANTNLPSQLKIPEHNGHIDERQDTKLNETLLENITNPPSPKLDASSYILIDYNSGEIIASKDPEKRVPPASLTKIMSMYIISNELKEGKLELTDLVNVSTKAWKMPGSRMFIEPNSNVTVADLIKGIVIQSGNDATVAMAEHIAGTEKNFVDMMNSEAQKLNLKDTHFANVSGLPAEDHYSSAKDMAILAKAVISEHPELYNLYKEKSFTYNDIKQYNRNRLLWKKSLNVDGLKTGHTDLAGYCQVTSATKGNDRLIAVEMGSKSEDMRAKNSAALIKHGFKYYETEKLFSDNKKLDKISVLMGAESEVPVGVLRSTYITIPKNSLSNLKYTLTMKKELHAPIKKHETVGYISIKLNNKTLKQIPLATLKDIPEGGIWTKIKDYLSSKVYSFFKKDNESYTEIDSNNFA